eukprot:COSAG02_NODE_5301_length_4458_cov_75.446662_5_plen_60_part_00
MCLSPVLSHVRRFDAVREDGREQLELGEEMVLALEKDGCVDRGSLVVVVLIVLHAGNVP